MKEYGQASYFKCNNCGMHSHDLKPGEYMYLISRQTASKKEEKDEEGKIFNRTLFLTSKVGFRYCDPCWSKVAGAEHKIA
jgi:hypothetical protein